MKILLLAAHPDDIEFGMGATFSKLIRQGHEIHVEVFCDCDIKKECFKSLENYNLKPFIYGYEVRTLPLVRQQILDCLIADKKEMNYDIIYLPCSFDIHQDHQVIHNEGVRAFKHSTIYGYSFPWNNISENLRHFEVVTKLDVLLKLKAIECYKSQKDRYYSTPDFIMSQLKVNGKIINQQFAERFEIIRQIKE